MIIDATDKGHAAHCPRCGWESRSYPVPDTAYMAGAKHQCEKKEKR
jgi:hypothetical protein